jgi:hypothetical protein
MKNNTKNNKENIISEFRDVSFVARRILNKIPAKETEFLHVINKFLSDCNYYAPEILKGPDAWIPFTNILNVYINSEELEWQQSIINIYMGTE